MKKLFIVTLCSLFTVFGLCSCTPDNSSKQSSKTSQSQAINYGSNPYVGYAGSTYRITRGTTDNYIIVMFWFYADGSGAWGYNDNGKTEVFPFHYDISGGVNVTWIKDETKEWGSGYFATLSDIGQCFVTEGQYIPRIS